MKKFISIAMVIFLVFTLTACDSGSKDVDRAYLEITTSMGGAFITTAFHGNNETIEKNRQIHALQYPMKINMADGESATIHFHCNQCGYDEVLEKVIEPYARMFACECKGTFEDGALKEYISVLIGDNANFESD